MDSLYYDDDPDWPVEVYDQVEVRIDGDTYDGIVRVIHPRSREVSVTYDDHNDLYRTTLNPRRKRHRAHISAVDLRSRDC